MINPSMIYVAELLIADRAEVLRQHVNIATSASGARAGSTLKRNKEKSAAATPNTEGGFTVVR